MPLQVKRVVTYSRCSTQDQKPEVQVNELRKYCHDRGWQLVEEIVDHGFSGGSDNRPGLKKLFTMVRSRQVDVVIVIKLDRLFRSMKHLVVTLQEFSELSVEFISLKDQIDLTTASGRLMLHIVGAFSEFEKNLIRERTMMGLAHAVACGKILGRPQLHDPKKIIQLRSQGLSYRQIAKQMNCSTGVVSAALRGERQTPKNQTFETAAKTMGKNEI